jgi:uncharacterized protein (TIGR00369 family)
MDDAMAARQDMAAGTLVDTLGIEMLELDPHRVRASMQVQRSVHQPYGRLHGGASVALAETVASVGGNLNVDPDRQMAVGLEINANHLRGVTDGVVTAEATPIHLGRTTQVWDVRISDEQGRMVCVSRCTLAVIPR